MYLKHRQTVAQLVSVASSVNRHKPDEQRNRNRN